MIPAALLLVLMAAAVAGCLFMIGAAALIVSSAPPESTTAAPAQAVTILKPLHGDEAGLFENLASFCEQQYSGPVQIIFGVHGPTDQAVAVVERLRTIYPGQSIELVIDERTAGTNPKVANLINMSGR